MPMILAAAGVLCRRRPQTTSVAPSLLPNTVLRYAVVAKYLWTRGDTVTIKGASIALAVLLSQLPIFS
jgi:hypothetical protein